MKRLELLVENGELAGRRFAVGEMGVRLGRSSSNDIHVPDEELSRNHCLFEPSGEAGIRVTDLASANGTKVNGERLGSEMRELAAGDIVEVGSMRLKVVGEKPVGAVDLGLGNAGAGGEKPGAAPGEPTASRRRSPLANILWCVVGVLGTLVAYLVSGSFSAPEEVVQTAPAAAKEEKNRVVEMSFEKVVADSSSIFRYYMSVSRDGSLNVVVDDVSSETRHVDRPPKRLDAQTLQRLNEILLDSELLSLESQYVGPEGEPPKLRSSKLRVAYANGVRSFSVVNTREPVAFGRACEKLETLAKNELGIWAIQRTRAELVADAAAAAEVGRNKWQEREVEYGNIYASMRAYREAISLLDTVDPKPQEYDAYLAALAEAERELDARYRDQRFKADRALNLGDWPTASVELQILCQIVPDRSDDRNIEAMSKLNDVEKRMKGAR